MARNSSRHLPWACLPERTGFFVLVGLLFLFPSCDTTTSTGNQAGKIMPGITGGAGEVLVVMDKLNWENSAGELLQDILKEEYPGLPQSEPLFDVSHITVAAFEGFYQFHRTIVLTTVQSGLAPRIRYKENVWAKPQIMIQLEAQTGEALKTLISEHDSEIQRFLIQYDRKRLMNTYKESKDMAIQKELTSHHQIQLAIPRGYNLDFSNDAYTSVSIEGPDFSQVIQIFEYPAGGAGELTASGIIDHRNSFTKKYTQGPNKDSYMTISPMYKPIALNLRNNNMDLIELRGLWELENGFMGGPFISHSVYDAKRHRIISVDGYLYHPNQKKRVKIKQLEAIIYSLEII